MEQVLIEKLNKILEINLDKERFGVRELAKEAGLSRSQLNRKLQSTKGKSTCNYIREFRLKKAMTMLQNNEATASEIAYRVGFSSPTYFNTCFKDYYGFPPGEAKIRNPKIAEKDHASENVEFNEVSQVVSEAPRPKKARFARRMVWINTLFILLLSVVSYNLYQNYKDQFSFNLSSKDNLDKSVAIIPFKNLSSEENDEFFTIGVYTSLLSRLSSIQGLKVISENTMEKYADTIISSPEIAKELDINYLINGNVQKFKDSIRVIINVINAVDDKQLKSMVFLEEFKNLFAMQGTIARSVATDLDLVLSETELEQIDKHPTENLQAYNLYVKGRFFWHRRTEEDLNKSIHYFNQAIKLDTTFALAYAGLADTYGFMPWDANNKDIDQKGIKQSAKFTDSMHNLAEEYALKSIALDKNNAEAHASLGLVLRRDWNWEASEKEFKLALKLNPNYAVAHHWYSYLLRTLGRRKEAREQIDLALNLDPNSYIFHHSSGDIYYEDGLFEKAISEYNMAKEINKFHPGSYDLSADCYTYWGKDDEAIAEYEECFKLMEPNLDKEDLELYYKSKEDIHNSGMMGVKRFWTNRLLKKGEYPYQVALGFSFLGEKKKALDWLEMAYEQRDPNLIMIRHSAEFNILHNDPRYLAILEKMNLGGYE
ncbi:MAG: helix-turn-helix domain-containing protein [Flavobacteriaceae bacterium]|nr:helix-turn-helix domain-containing protein [Flavobacteriaceae bacterium]